jgi:gluconolactonase
MNVTGKATQSSAARLPGPPELVPGRPDAVIDLQRDEGVALVKGQWRYSDAKISEIAFVEVAADLGPGDVPNRTYDVLPHAQAPDFDDSAWQILSPADTQKRLSQGRVCFNWYRIVVTIPDRIADFDPTGSTAIFEVIIDDYAEIWVNGELPLVQGMTGGQVVGGFNAPNRVVLGRDLRPGDTYTIAVFGINGPISASPANYIWIRTATIDFYEAQRARPAWPADLRVGRRSPGLDEVVGPEPSLERVAGGFEITDGPVWAPHGGLLFSSPNTNVIYRWDPVGAVSLFRTKTGYRGVDIGAFKQPGSSGLTFDTSGRLTICQHGNRRIIRVEPHGNVTVLADRYQGLRLNSPHDLVYRSDGLLYFTDPPFGLPDRFDDPDRDLSFSGVFMVKDGEVTLIDDSFAAPSGLAFSPDGSFLYVGNHDLDRKIIMRYEIGRGGTVVDASVFVDLTGAPGEGAIDGLKLDRAGNLYVCGPGGLWVLSADGEHLGTLQFPERPHNLAWGDEDGRTLYLTALTSIYRLAPAIPGVLAGRTPTQENR